MSSLPGNGEIGVIGVLQASSLFGTSPMCISVSLCLIPFVTCIALHPVICYAPPSLSPRVCSGQRLSASCKQIRHVAIPLSLLPCRLCPVCHAITKPDAAFSSLSDLLGRAFVRRYMRSPSLLRSLVPGFAISLLLANHATCPRPALLFSPSRAPRSGWC